VINWLKNAECQAEQLRFFIYICKKATMETIRENDEQYICELDVPCFQSLSDDHIELLKSNKTQLLYRKGEMISKQGSYSSYIILVVDGLVKQYVEVDDMRNTALKIIMPGEFIGLSAVFNHKTFHYSTIAISDCQVFLIEKSPLVKIIRENGEFGYNIINRYSENNDMLYAKIKRISGSQMYGRIADTLLYVNEIKNNYPEVFTLLSRKDIGDFASISPENTIKTLKSFEKDGFIKLHDKDIEVLNLDKLTELSEKG